MPDRPPLKPVIHGKVAREGYTVERVYFQSLPGHFVTGSLYRPVGRSGKLPAVLSPHGHWPGGRFNEATTEEIRRALVTGAERFQTGGRVPLQARSVQLARMGVVVFLYDMVGYADSVQITLDVAHGGRRERAIGAGDGGLFFSSQAELRLQSIMGLNAWNATRALDFLTSLPDVDAARIGVQAAFGHGQRPFHRFDDLDQRNRVRLGREAIAAMRPTEGRHQSGLRERLEQLGDGGGFQARAFGEFGRAEHGLGRGGGERRQHDGGVIGELGDPEHRGGLAMRTEIVRF